MAHHPATAPRLGKLTAQYWAVREQVRFGKLPKVNPKDFPDFNLDAPNPRKRVDLLLRAVKARCFHRLREMTQSAFHGQGIICVLPRDGRRSEDYLWITSVIDISLQSHSLVEVQKFPADISPILPLQHLCREVGGHIQAWPYTIKTHLVYKWNHPACSEHLWREFFPEQPNFFATYPDMIYANDSDEKIRILAPHMTKDNAAKSLLLLLRDGFILFIPEPDSLDTLVRLLSGYWLSKPAVPASSCVICGWQHRPGDFTEIIHPKTGERWRLNAKVQALNIGRLHDARENHVEWVDIGNLELKNYTTLSEAFRGKSQKAYELLVEPRRKQFQLKPPAN